MDTTVFWNLIDSTLKKKTINTRIRAFENMLKGLTGDEVKDFLIIWHEYQKKLYTTSILAAGILMTDGDCSDDGFEYFRSGITMLGYKKFSRIVQEPDSLAMLSKSDINLLLDGRTEEYRYALHDAYEALFSTESLGEMLQGILAYENSDPEGKEYSENLESLGVDFPKLFALYQEREKRANEEFQKIDFDKLDPDGLFPDWLRTR